MNERRRQREIPPTEDPQIVLHYREGGAISAGSLATLFSKSSSEKQEKLSYGCLRNERYTGGPDLVLSWITEDEIRDKIKLWCIGHSLKIKEPRVEDSSIDPLLAKDDEFIRKFSPYLRQVDLARLITLRRYKESDPNDEHALVCGTYRLLGEYLGPRRYYRRDGENPHPLPLPELPAEIFSDSISREILIESEREALLPMFNRDEYEGFRYLDELAAQVDDPAQLEFIKELQEYYRNASAFPADRFKSYIAGSQKDLEDEQEVQYSPFPAFHQREFAYRFVHKPIGRFDLLIGATRTMKSGAAQLAMKAAGVKSPIITCPSGITKLNWERELQEKLEELANILTIESTSQLRALATHGTPIKPDYTIIGYQVLSRLNLEESVDLFQRLKENLGWDGLIEDEVHLAKEPDTECTQQLYALSRTLAEDAPRIAMTATGLINGVEDLDAPVRTLLPYRYPNEGDFTRAARNDPYLVSALLHG